MLDRATIAAHLREIAALLELRGGNRFKARAFARGARSLDASREPVARLIEEGRLADLPGIGFAISRQIEELHRTGRSELLDTLREGLPAGVLELAEVSGVGLFALRLLHEKLGIATLDDLRRAASEGRLREVPGFGKKREAKIHEAIRKYETAEKRVPLAEGLALAEILARDIEELDAVDSAHVAGSLRRSVEVARDVDLVVAATSPATAMTAIKRLPRFAGVVEGTETETRLRLPDGTRVDVVVVPAPSLPTAWIFATGSRAHVDKLMALAASRGYLLEPTALVSTETKRRVPVEVEADVYRALGLAFVPPELREDLGEIEAASDGALDLVRADDLRGFVHCHSTWSDGRASVEAMARAAQDRGARFITITDHSRAAHYANGLDEDRLKRQWDEIDEVQERVKIRILKGTEADILADGALDWPDRILERLDVVIASIHNRHRQDEDKMTRRVLRALRHPVFKIWGHPLGRLVTSRPPIPLRVEEALDALAESQGAIEISGDPHRLDLEPKWTRLARERGLPFVISVDAHSVRELDNVRYGVGLARRAGVRASEVLNARSTAAFVKAVRPSAARRAA
jgi:DNA polymerase (family X)